MTARVILMQEARARLRPTPAEPTDCAYVRIALNLYAGAFLVGCAFAAAAWVLR